MRIIVVIRTEEHHKTRLIAAAGEHEILFPIPEEQTKELLSTADIIIGAPKVSDIKDSNNLKLLLSSTAGVNNYIEKGALPEGTILTNSTGAYGLAISEHMIGALFMLRKKLHLYRDNQAKCLWRDMGDVLGIEGSTVLVLGMGDIGGDFARKLKALGAYVIGVRRACTEKPDYVDELHLTEETDKLLPRADVVAMPLPSTPETYQFLNRGRIALLKETAIVLNVGRGNAIDTDALCDAVESGKIAGAALDVTDPEPLPSGHRMWKIENICITPHISGFLHLAATHDRIVEIVSENLERYFSGKPLRNIIDFEKGYANRNI